MLLGLKFVKKNGFMANKITDMSKIRKAIKFPAPARNEIQRS